MKPAMVGGAPCTKWKFLKSAPPSLFPNASQLTLACRPFDLPPHERARAFGQTPRHGLKRTKARGNFMGASGVGQTTCRARLAP